MLSINMHEGIGRLQVLSSATVVFFILQLQHLYLFVILRSRDLSVNTIVREYVLPDYIDVHRGYLRSPSEKPKDAVDRPKLQGYILRLSNERFTVPELLFHPTDVGYTEMGISEAVQYLLTERLPPGVRPGAMANVLLIGGNSKFSGYKERVWVLCSLSSALECFFSVNCLSEAIRMY